MTMLALGGVAQAFAIVVLALALFGALAALVLLHRLMKPLGEIPHYADDILAAGLGIARNVDGVDELARTRDLATALPGLVRGGSA